MAHGLGAKRNQAISWIRNKVSNLNVKSEDILNDKRRKRSKPEIGKMYFYHYDAKTKDKLPYWDYFPLTIPIEYYKDGFLGLNLHYLPPNNRIALLNRLMQFKSTPDITEATRLKLNYQLLAATKKFDTMKPSIKRYLYGHLRSHLIEVGAKEWDIAVFLPVEDFRVAKSQVWKNSR